MAIQHLAIYSPTENTWYYSLNTRFVIVQEIIHCIGGSKFGGENDEKGEECGGDKYFQYNMDTKAWTAMPNVDKFVRIYCFGEKHNGKQ